MESGFQQFRWLRLSVFGLIGLAAAGSWCSCMSMMLATAPDPVDEVAAEFVGLRGQRVVVVTWADPGTVFEYPHIQFELSQYVNYYLKQNIDPVALITARQVAGFQRDTSGWETMAPVEIGRKFDADYVIHLELTEYTTRGEGGQYLLAGRGRVGIAVYDVNAAPDDQHKYSGQVQGRYPEQGTVGTLEADTAAIHNGTLNTLAQLIARKFYDHEIRS